MRDMSQGNELEDEREHEVLLESPAHDGAPAPATGAPAPSTNPEADHRRPWCARTKHKVRPHMCRVHPHLCQVRPHQPLVRPHHLRRLLIMRQKTQVRPHLRSGAPAPPFDALAPCVPERKFRSLNPFSLLVLEVTLYSSFLHNILGFCIRENSL